MFWCELGNYFFSIYLLFLSSTSYEISNATTRILITADEHIMGPIKSNLIDKYRREWQMRLAFNIMNYFFNPDSVIHLGDSLDEGSFAGHKSFIEMTKDFYSIFHTQKKQVFLLGNHDIGFHDQVKIYPYYLDRFIERFHATPTVQLISINDVDLVAINSMAFYNDSCLLCSEAKKEVEKMSRYIKSNPILLTHFPLYRYDDSACDYPITYKERAHIPNVEGHDCLHKQASNFLIKTLSPRLILSGHTHMKCLTEHQLEQLTVTEITLSSFNYKYAINKPNFMFLSANSTHLSHSSCDLYSETSIMFVYIIAALSILARYTVFR